MIDTHTHLYVDEFKEDIDEVIHRAQMNGIKKCFLPAIDQAEIEKLINLESKYPEMLFAMAGLHPCSVKENYKEELAIIEQQLSTRQFAGIGESGLDFYWNRTFEKEQYESLQTHAEWAIRYNRPLILHTRNATQETIDVIKKCKDSNLKGIFHCFSGTLQNANDIIDLGFSLGIGGVVTFKNSGLAEVVAQIDLQHIVLETDSPYLAPMPYRGKRNESSYLTYIVKKLSEIKGVSEENICKETTKNANQIFAPF